MSVSRSPRTRGVIHTPGGSATPAERFTEPLSALVERADLPSIVERYAGPGRRAGDRFTFSCPNPEHPDRRPSFVVSRDPRGRWRGRCFSQCDTGSLDALALVMWLDRIAEAGEGANRLRELMGEPIPVRAGRGVTRYGDPKCQRCWRAVLSPGSLCSMCRAFQAQTERKTEAREMTPPEDTAPTLAEPEGSDLLRRYCEARGWDLATAERFRLRPVRGWQGHPAIRHPYLVPNANGEPVTVWWQDRHRSSAPVSWMAPARSTPIPYNLGSLHGDEITAVVICEGPADTITASVVLGDRPDIAVIGVPGSQAWRDGWRHLVTGLRVIVATDADPAGDMLADRIGSSVDGRIIRYRPAHGDLTDTVAEVGREAVREALLHALGPLPAPDPVDYVTRLLEAFPGAVWVNAPTADTGEVAS